MHKKIVIGLLLGVAAAAPALADTALVINSGWQDDELDTAGDPTAGSNWTFTIASGAHFSVVDCCNTGDVYTLSGSTTGTTTYYAGSGVQGTGSYGFYWTDASWSKIDKYLGPGTYSIGITGNGQGGLPAGLGVRLDSTVPEPAVWGLMLAGFGLAGTVMRRRSAMVLG